MAPGEKIAANQELAAFDLLRGASRSSSGASSAVSDVYHSGSMQRDRERGEALRWGVKRFEGSLTARELMMGLFGRHCSPLCGKEGLAAILGKRRVGGKQAP